MEAGWDRAGREAASVRLAWGSCLFPTVTGSRMFPEWGRRAREGLRTMFFTVVWESLGLYLCPLVGGFSWVMLPVTLASKVLLRVSE